MSNMVPIIFESKHLKLDGIIFYPSDRKGKQPAILFVHGWTSEKVRSFQYAQALADLGYICFLFDMRGHGKSEGNINTFTHKDFLDDVLAAYDHLLVVESVDADNISAIGSSFGGYLVALLSAKRKITNLVLRAPADYSNETFNTLKILVAGDDRTVLNWRKQVKEPTETFALESLHHFMGDLLVIESENDNKIPHQTITNYINAITDARRVTYVLIRGAPHGIKAGRFRSEIEKILTHWFQTRIQ